MIKFLCEPEKFKELKEIVEKISSDYPILSDLEIKTENANSWALDMILQNKHNEFSHYMYCIPPDEELGRYGYHILAYEKFFTQSDDGKKSSIIHELGHVICDQTGVFKELNQKLMDAEEVHEKYFEEYFSPLIDDSRIFFNSYVHELLKFPEEFYVENWIKKNFEELFEQRIDRDFDDLLHQLETFPFEDHGEFSKFSLFSTMLSGSVKARLLDKKYSSRTKKFSDLRRRYWIRLKKVVDRKEIRHLNYFENKFLQQMISTKEANTLLYESYIDFCKKVVLKVPD